MNSRERLLAIILIVTMFGVVGGFAGWQLVLSPGRQRDESIKKLTSELKDLEARRLELEAEQFIYETRTRKKSLPLNIKAAQSEYKQFIDRMLQQAKFPTPVIQPHEPDTKEAPAIGKKPVYTKLDFDVKVKGKLDCFIEFLYTFYRQPILQQIKSVKIIKPSTSQVTRELDFSFTIEALVLDRAEDRDLLIVPAPVVALASGGAAASSFALVNTDSGLGTPFTVAGALARAGSRNGASARDEYQRILGKNIFFDPPPRIVVEKPVEEKKEEVAKEADLAPNLELQWVSHSNGISRASIHDHWKKEEYEIEISPRGQVKVSQYWYLRVEEENGNIGQARKKQSERPFLQFGSEETGNLRLYRVRRVLENELLLETYDSNREKLQFILGGTASLALPGKLHLCASASE